MARASFVALLLGVMAGGSVAQHTRPQSAAPKVEMAPASSTEVRQWTIAAAKEPRLSQAAKLALVRQKIKYVFVLFQENRSFDFYFGTYPGADGLYSRPASQTAGFVQPIVNLDGSVSTISPFKIPFSVTDVNGEIVPLYPSDLAGSNHNHVAMDEKLHVDANHIPRNDRYALTEEGVTLIDGKPSKIPSLERKQLGEMVMSHIDCDAAPFMWRYADRFTLFDHFFDTVIGPSTPNAIAMIAGQSGETQWMLHPEVGDRGNKDHAALPMVDDPVPYWGSLLDTKGEHPRQPNPAEPSKSGVKPGPDPRASPSPNLTFATLPLSFMGSAIEKTTAADYDPAFDLLDVQADIKKIAGHGVPATNWGWYQQGYDHEPTDATDVASHDTYIVHHNAPQYFGYIANNPQVNTHMHGLGDFFTDIGNHALPDSGVFYIRGGYGNIFGEHPLDPNPKLLTEFHGDDDHPGYSDSQLSESLLAREINAIAESPYWSQSVILIAYDESDGLYDHARPRIRSYDPAGLPLDQGPRIPAILISPYGVVHGVSHEMAEHSSIIRLVDEIFHLIPLADLPDEARGRAIGVAKYHQRDLGPGDDKVRGVGDLLSGFSNSRLLGRSQPLPASYAEIAPAEIGAYPHYEGRGCQALHIRPTDTGRSNPLPVDFNPRPDTSPGLPTSGTWTP
ncbi:MAG TPA: alkaline phosphatase family protein [Acidobacteriaceae bacterium]|nr:alkaline phosphatase family protein [Acidobacteriaceae bacterium]